MTQQKMRRNVRVFLSYSLEDEWYAQTLKARLSNHPDVTVFTTKSLSAGENWQVKLRQALVQCSMFLVVLSPRSVESSWVLYELGAAWALGKRIVAVVTDPAVRSKIPVPLEKIQLLEDTDLREPRAIDRLLNDYDGEAWADDRIH